MPVTYRIKTLSTPPIRITQSYNRNVIGGLKFIAVTSGDTPAHPPLPTDSGR